jgi:diguanylate cyclase (GGDEF)-like protein
MALASEMFNDNVNLLKSEVSKSAYQGILIAVISIVVANILVSWYYTNAVTLDGIITAQKNNPVLWILNIIPFVFGFWGQYSSSIIAYQAGAIIFDQTHELREKAETLEKQASYNATHDSLTDLPNRALFYDRVEQSIVSALNQGRLLSILLVEITNYKEIYDTLGRNSSDLLLKQLAARLQGVVLGSDKVARIDGNIFSVLLNDIVDESETQMLAQHIQTALVPVFAVEKLHIPVHTNIGIVYFPEHGEDVDTLVQKAGVALYIASKTNEGYAVYEPAFDDHSPRRLTLMSELRRAIEHNQLELYYQAKINLPSGSLYGAEALVRWHHPKHGFISPSEFIPMAERTRMIRLLTVWVLKEAFRQCVLWHKEGYDLVISVNLSTRDLHDPELPDLISGIAASSGLKPEWIILEITESSIMNDPEQALTIINRLHDMGYRFSIDDYGTGYSSLGYLKKLPLTELKIDRSFVSDILHSESDAVIVNATINLAHNLGLHVTAEGVENEQIKEKLIAYGCDIAQGYYFNKPQSVNDFIQWALKDSTMPENNRG